MKKIYGKWYPWEDLIAIPMMLYYALKGEKMNELLEEKIIKAKSKASKKEFSEKELYEHQIEYENLDNLFSVFFKEVEKSEVHSFEEKIEYCLQKYSEESKRHISASRVIILQGNFLAGAEKTLFLYFTQIEGLKKNEQSLSSPTKTSDLFNISNAQIFKKYSTSNQLDVSKINFFELEKNDVIYTNVDGEIRFVEKRCKSDLLILICYLFKIRIIDLEFGDNLLSEIANFIEEVLGKENKVDNSTISKINTFVTRCAF